MDQRFQALLFLFLSCCNIILKTSLMMQLALVIGESSSAYLGFNFIVSKAEVL